jgi:hypothetical protein
MLPQVSSPSPNELSEAGHMTSQGLVGTHTTGVGDLRICATDRTGRRRVACCIRICPLDKKCLRAAVCPTGNLRASAQLGGIARNSPAHALLH